MIDFAPWVAVAISILALGVTFWQAHLARMHNKLSVRPCLVGHSSCSDDLYSLTVRNDGLGPAIITAARVSVHGVLVEGQGGELVQKAFGEVEGVELIEHEFFYIEFVLPAGHSISICKVRFLKEVCDKDWYLASKLSLEIEYKSAYNEACPIYRSRQV